MPLLVHAMPKYRKHRASGQAIVTIEGRDFYLGPHATKASRTEYDRIVGEWLANNRRLPRTAQYRHHGQRTARRVLASRQGLLPSKHDGTASSELDVYRASSAT